MTRARSLLRPLLPAPPGERDVHRRARVRRRASGLVARRTRGARRRDARVIARLVGDASGAGSPQRFATTSTRSTPSSRAAFSRFSSPRMRARTACAAIRRSGPARRSSRSCSLMIRDFAPVERARCDARSARLDAIPDVSRRSAARRSATRSFRPRGRRKAQRECEGAAILLGERDRRVDRSRRAGRRDGRVACAPPRRARESAFAQFADWLGRAPPRRMTRWPCGAELLRSAARRAAISAQRSRADLLAEARAALATSAMRSSTTMRARRRRLVGERAGADSPPIIRRPTTISRRSSATWNACRETAPRARRRDVAATGRFATCRIPHGRATPRRISTICSTDRRRRSIAYDDVRLRRAAAS